MRQARLTHIALIAAGNIHPRAPQASTPVTQVTFRTYPMRIVVSLKNQTGLFPKVTVASSILLLHTACAMATIFYVATNGSDSNNGSPSHPLATIAKALTLATASGDQIQLEAGTYNVPNVIAGYEDGNVYAAVNLLTSANSGITIEADPGDTTRPVLNFSAINPTGYRVAAFWVPAGVSNVTFQGFDVTGLQENITTTNNQSVGFGVYGCTGCTWNQVNVHDGECAGFYLEKAAANNTFYECDAYNLTGINSYSYGNADGFGCHPAAGGTGNVYNACRSWNNSDDGYDCLNASTQVTFEYCWSYKNGNNGGNGNGFKVGGWGSTPQNQIPNPLPAHIVKYCLSADNASHGFYCNHQPGQAATWTNNTAYNNSGPDFDTLERTAPNYSSSSPQTDSNDIPGVAEVMHYNLGYAGYSVTGDYNESGSIVTDNSWTESITLTNSDFVSTDATQMTEARQSNGSLPTITFMHQVSGSPGAGLGCF